MTTRYRPESSREPTWWADVHEFFAVFSSAYFNVTDEIGRDVGHSTVEEEYTDIFKFLDEIYGARAAAGAAGEGVLAAGCPKSVVSDAPRPCD